MTHKAGPEVTLNAACPDGIEESMGKSHCVTSYRKLHTKFTGKYNGKVVRCVSDHVAHAEETLNMNQATLVVTCK